MGDDHPSRFEEQYSTDDVLGVFGEVPGPAVVPADVKDALGCSGQTARNKLEELRRDGRIEKREKGRVSLWWLAADEEVSDDA
jgi:predicted transcriptional regulator